MNGAERRAVGAFLREASHIVMGDSIPYKRYHLTLGLVTFHLTECARDLSVPDSNVVLVVRERTERLRQDVAKLINN